MNYIINNLQTKTLKKMETKFTKGEWRQSHREKPNEMYSTEVYDEQGETICTLAWHKVPIVGGFETDREANAKLIAAAPDMFNALEELLAQVKQFTAGNIGEQDYFRDEISNAKKAIKKATE